MPETERVTDDEANAALQQLLGNEESETAEEPAQTAQTAEEQPSEAQPADETEAVEKQDTDQPVKQPEEAAEDDLESLKQRLQKLEEDSQAKEERYQQRLQAQAARSAENERILRGRFLQKSTATDKALKALQRAKSDEGIGESEIDSLIGEIQSTMNPASTSFSPPEPTSAAGSEDQALVLNSFLNEQSMTADEADEFGKWITNEAGTAMSPMEQAVANESLGGFLRLAHVRWQQSIQAANNENQRSDAVRATQSIQRTQREAARAASPSTTGPKKQTAAPPQEDDAESLMKMKGDQRHNALSSLLRQAVEQSR